MSMKIDGVEYKAVPFRPAGDGPDEPYDAYEPGRYCIVNVSTGEIVDDAQGYGYRTIQKAYAGFGFRTKAKAQGGSVGAYGKAIKERKNGIRRWVQSHRAFEGMLEDDMFQRAKNGEPPCGPADVEAILEGLGLECPFSGKEILDAL